MVKSKKGLRYLAQALLLCYSLQRIFQASIRYFRGFFLGRFRHVMQSILAAILPSP